MVLILTRMDLEKVLAMGEVMEVVEGAFAQLAKGTVKMPLRTIIGIDKHKGFVFYMPAYLEGSDALAVKIVSLYEENLEKYRLPTIFATIQLNDPKTGMPLALMEGGYITAMRTGAASGVATKYLARRNSRVVGIVGAGIQARAQLWAVREARDVEKVFVYDAVAGRARGYAEEMSERLGVNIIPVSSVEKAVREADILVTATTAKEPVLNGNWLQPGTHINAIGWMGRDARELDSNTVKSARLIVDSKEAVLAESGDILIPIKEGIITKDHIYAELGEIVIGRKAGRVSDNEITLWKSVGLAIQDAVTAKLAYQKAQEMNVGRETKLL
ncbi:MAG: ornithine cyclodeaminase family protein [Candidatus Bathyarchaeia archaeon]